MVLKEAIVPILFHDMPLGKYVKFRVENMHLPYTITIQQPHTKGQTQGWNNYYNKEQKCIVYIS